VLEVFGQVDRGHPAPAELALDPVAVGQSSLEALEQIQGTAPLRILPERAGPRDPSPESRGPDSGEAILVTAR
jgi:hypothetical protein